MNEKKLNILCYITIVMFFVYTIFYVIFGCVQLKREDQKLDALYDYANKINQQAEKENLIFKDDTKNDDEPIELLYTEKTKLKALVEGYNKTLNSNSYIAEVNGDLSLDLPLGLYGKVKMRNFGAKYSPGKSFVETINYVTDSSMAVNGILKSRSQYGEKQIIEGESIMAMRSLNVSYINNQLISNYDGYSYEKSENLSILKHLYIINENTVQDVTYFKVKMKNGKPVAYYIQATLDPKSSTANYAQYISNPIGSFPNFKSVKITIVLNTKGEMIAATSIDEFTASSEGFEFTATLTNNYAISCINEKIVKEYK